MQSVSVKTPNVPNRHTVRLDKRGTAELVDMKVAIEALLVKRIELTLNSLTMAGKEWL